MVKMFEALSYSNDTEKSEFEKYRKIRGKFVLNQIYEYLLNFNYEKVKYSELSTCIRYDKNLRDTLYIYLATFEEYLRAIILDKYDLESHFKLNRKEERYIEKMADSMYESKNKENSELYAKFSLDLGETISLVSKLKMFSDEKLEEFENIRFLRNNVMHHNLIVLGKEISLEKVAKNKEKMEKGIVALANNLPGGYRQNFINAINSLRCDFEQYKMIIEA